MKRLLLLLGLLAICASAQGLSLTLQNPSEFSEYLGCNAGTHGGTCSYVQSANGGNSYISIGSGSQSDYAFIINADPLLTDYAAATVVGGTWNSGFGTGAVRLYDSSGATLFTWTLGTGAPTYARYEVKVVGGVATLYKNNVSQSSSGALAQNPSYVGWGAHSLDFATLGNTYIDDIVYGSSENKYIFGSPQDGYYIKKDMVNPAASGFFKADGTLISSFNMSTQWGRGSTAAENIQLMEWGNNYVVNTFSTGSSMSGSKSWAIYDYIINNPTAPYGYYVSTIPGSGKYSAVIPYIADGCTISFDQDSYARGDTAIVTYSIDSGGYWDTTTYLYRLDTLNVFGTVVDTQIVTTQAGSKQVKFESSDPLGVYYTVMIATPIAGGDDLWMNYDTCDLTGYMKFYGDVINGENETVINGANVSIYQGTTFFNHTTSADGNYTTDSAFYSGAVTYINVTADCFYQYTYSFTPLEAKSIQLNFTLTPLNPVHSGLAILGTDRDTTYGRPIPYATNTIYNTTYGESYSVTANGAGWYLLDTADGAYLTDRRLYFVVGSKNGYSDSVAYQVIPRGM